MRLFAISLLLIIVNSCRTVHGQQQGQIKIDFDSGQFYKKGNYYVFGCIRNSPEELPPPVTPKQCDVPCTSKATFETFVPVWRAPCVGTEAWLFLQDARLFFSVWNKTFGAPPATFVGEKSLTIAQYLNLGLNAGDMLELDLDPFVGRIFVKLSWTPVKTSGESDNSSNTGTTTTASSNDNYDSD